VWHRLNAPTSCCDYTESLWRVRSRSLLEGWIGRCGCGCGCGGKVWKAEDIVDYFFTAVASRGCRVVLSICFFWRVLIMFLGFVSPLHLVMTVTNISRRFHRSKPPTRLPSHRARTRLHILSFETWSYLCTWSLQNWIFRRGDVRSFLFPPSSIHLHLVCPHLIKTLLTPSPKTVTRTP
jgi:hypothetical protein